MNEEAGVTKLTNFAGKKLNALRTIAENDCLRDVQLGKQSVEAMELLALFEESVVLSETFKCQLVRNLNVLGVGDVALLEVTDLNWVGCAK